MLLPAIIILLFTVGCSKIPIADDSYVSSIVKTRIGNNVHWNQNQKKELIEDAVKYLTQHELTSESSVQISLLNNPEIQAHFEKLGIAHADLIQAGLFQNPLFDGFLRFPNKSSFTVNTQFSVTQNFLDIFMIPLRKKVAKAEFEQTKLRVAKAILDLSFDVRETYYKLAASLNKHKLISSLVKTVEASYELAHEQLTHGNINELDFQNRKSEYLESTLELSNNQIEITKLREKMTKLLGFSTANNWKIKEDLSYPQHELSLDDLEQIALSQRLDLEIARFEIDRIEKMGATKKWWSYTNGSIGISSEKEPDGCTVTGPLISAAIPFFNFGQADRKRLHAMYRQSIDNLKALEIEVLSEVRTAKEQLKISISLVSTYHEKIVPLQEESISASMKYYNVMGLGVYELLNAKKRGLRAEINYTNTLCNYWIGRVMLDRALGGKLHLAVKDFAQEKIND